MNIRPNSPLQVEIGSVLLKMASWSRLSHAFPQCLHLGIFTKMPPGFGWYTGGKGGGRGEAYLDLLDRAEDAEQPPRFSRVVPRTKDITTERKTG